MNAPHASRHHTPRSAPPARLFSSPYWVFDIASSSRAVYFWDHETSEPGEVTYVVASSLWHFVLGVLLEKDRDDDKAAEHWPFDRDAALAFDPELERVQNAAMPWDANY